MGALALGGPAAAVNYGSPQMGTVGTQFGSTIERLSDRNIPSIDGMVHNRNEIVNSRDQFENNNTVARYTSYTTPNDMSNWSNTTSYTTPDWSNPISTNKGDIQESHHSNEVNNLDNTEINDIIGENKQGNAKENKVFIGEKKVLKTYPKNYKKNLNKALKASEYGYGPKVYKTGKLKDGTGFIVSERLNTVENVEELIENNNKGFKQLEEGLEKMHTYGKHKHGDIHLGNVLYRYGENKSKQFVWNDFDLGESTSTRKSRKKQDLKIELEELVNIREGVVVLGID